MGVYKGNVMLWLLVALFGEDCINLGHDLVDGEAC